MRPVRVDYVYDIVEDQIMNQILLPGTRINIDALARELDVSPTPVREALRRLAAERYVQFLPYKGYSVISLPTPRQFADMMGVRRLLEAEGVRQAVARATVTHLQAILRELNAADIALVEATLDARRWRSHSRNFHNLLMHAADNEVLYNVWRSLKAPFAITLVHQGLVEVDYPMALAEHRAIYDAIRSRNADAAVATILAHIDAAEERMAGAFDRNGQYREW